jgi:DNA polymerase-1
MAVASPGMLLLEVDLSQGEFRFAAAFSQDEVMVRAYKEGRDFHREIQLLLPDMGDEEDALRQAGGDQRAADSIYTEWRIKAKAANFGGLYGREAYSYAREYNWPESKAIRFVRDYWAAVPGLARWVKEIHALVEKQGYLESPFGRQRRFGFLTDQSRPFAYKEGVNFLPQSTSSDCVLSSLCDIIDEFWEAGVRPIIFLHDSIVMEVPPQILREVAQRVREIIVNTPKRYVGDIVPFEIDAKVGDRWGSLEKYKIG